MRYSLCFSAAVLMFLAGCSTHIQAPDEPNQPSLLPLGTYTHVYMKPVQVGHSGNDSGDRAAVVRVQEELTTCMRRIFPMLSLRNPGETNSVLVIEPTIVDVKKVDVAERIFLGPIAGSSAIVLQVTYTDATQKKLLADSKFYLKANSWTGMATAGTTDNLMLSHISNDACEYARNNFR